MTGRRVFLVSGGAIAGFVILLAYAFSQLLYIQRMLDTDPGESMLWAASQAEREARRLNEAVLAASLGLAGADEIALRLDLLYSRFALLSQEPQRSYFRRLGALETIERNEASLGRLSSLPDARGGLGPEAARAVLLPMLDDLGRLSNRAMVAERDEKGAQRDRRRKLMYLVVAAMAGLSLASLVLCWQLVSSMRAAMRAQRELRGQQDALERTVADRTAALHAALATERNAKEILRGFITTVSHQFRTPLSIIDMIAQRIARNPGGFPPDVLGEKARRVLQASRRLTQIVASVTTAARMDEGGLTLVRAPRDLNAIVRDACAYQRELAPGREIALRLSPDRLDCDCDAALIEQVVLNLLSNALKYSAADSVVSVSLAGDASTVACSVRDDGMGIPRDAQHHVFERFFRAPNAASITGSGLGLSLSRTIADLHGGSLSFVSREGEGSTFTLTLPRADTRDAP